MKTLRISFFGFSVLNFQDFWFLGLFRIRRFGCGFKNSEVAGLYHAIIKFLETESLENCQLKIRRKKLFGKLFDFLKFLENPKSTPFQFYCESVEVAGSQFELKIEDLTRSKMDSFRLHKVKC